MNSQNQAMLELQKQLSTLTNVVESLILNAKNDHERICILEQNTTPEPDNHHIPENHNKPSSDRLN